MFHFYGITIYNLYLIKLFALSNKISQFYKSRLMELSCKRDIHFMFLLEGAPVPDHAAFAIYNLYLIKLFALSNKISQFYKKFFLILFLSIHFAPCSKRILAQMSNALFDLGEISGETVFIDGTKIEAVEVLVDIHLI